MTAHSTATPMNQHTATRKLLYHTLQYKVQYKLYKAISVKSINHAYENGVDVRSILSPQYLYHFCRLVV